MVKDVTGAAVGLLIPETVTDVDREIFESLLAELTTVFRTQARFNILTRY